MKARNANVASELLRSIKGGGGQMVGTRELQFPPKKEQTREFLEKLIKTQSAPYDLVVDISAIPRSLLWDIVDVVQARKALGKAANQPDNIYLAYSWAQDYPEAMRDESLGRVLDSVGVRDLEQIVAGANAIDAIVLTSGSPHLAFRVVDSLLMDTRRQDAAVELVNFFGPDGFDLS